MTDLKTLLKEARKFIDDNNYKEAQECCKNILRKDKQNYLGLVLLGKSLQDSDQAPLAFQKAIASKPDHPLAWQGLANYYENKEDEQSKIKLLTLYGEMLKLQIDKDKSLEILNKVGELGCSLKDNKSITILLNYMDNNSDNSLNEIAKKNLISILKSDIVCQEEYSLKLLNKLKDIISNEHNDNIYILIGKVILQKNDYVEAIDEIMKLDFFESSVIFREWLCKYLCTQFIKNDSFCGFDIEKYKDDIITGIENSKYPGLLNSMICYIKGLYLDAYKQCVPLVNYQEADETEAIFIIKCTLMLKKWSVAQKLATNFLLKVKSDKFGVILKKFLFISLAEQKKWKQAISVGKEIPKDILNINEQVTLAKCYIEVNEDIEHSMKDLQTTEHYLQLKALLLIKQEKYSEAIAILEQIEDPDSKLFFCIGKAYWELKQYNKSYINLLKAAKLDAEHADTFLYLGMFYQHCKADFSKAKKCYEKAYSLNNIDLNIIRNLSDVYIKLELINDNFNLLCNTNQSVLIEQSWISFRLGLYYINNRQWENAILQFRNVIRSNPNDIIAFECLADAYFSRGSFTSALKAYNKVILMNSKKSLHCLCRIGYIHSILTQYEEAIITFENILRIEPHSTLALKGIAETWMRIATKKFNAKLYGSARDMAQNAINYIVKAISKQKKFTCLWNLLGNALIFITKLPDKYCFVWLKFDDYNDIIKKEKLDIYSQALACYSMTAKQKLQLTSYDLASTYLDYYHASQNILHCQIAFQLTLAGIKSKPSAWRNWNLLGKVCIFMKKFALAQHCFIKALLVSRKWSEEVWCNLGILYIKINLHKLGNYCFWRGQSTLPSYPHSWIGQGLIAEIIREEEAMDLFRHASCLGYHPESALGYADWVCRTIKHDDYKNSSELKYVIDGLDAIPCAMDLITWFSTYEPNNPYSCNMLGILQERSGLLHTALESYHRALEYAEDQQNIILLNIGRIFLRLAKYDDAIKNYKAITEASLNSACGLAFALFKKGLYEEAYSAYDTALHWLSNNDGEKADLLVAMAGIVYMYKGTDDAKTLLFHSIQVSQKKPTANSLFAICSLGIINSDQGLSKLALGELRKYERYSKYGYDIGFLKSFLLVEKDLNQAIKILSDSLHDYPDNTLLWFCMAQYCLNVTNAKAKIASSCAQRAMCSAQNCEKNNASTTAKMLATASIAEHIAGDKIKAMLLAKAGLHIYPCQSDIWAALVFSVITNKMWSKKTNWISNRTGHIRKNLEITKALGRWVNLLEKKISMQIPS